MMGASVPRRNPRRNRYVYRYFSPEGLLAVLTGIFGDDLLLNRSRSFPLAMTFHVFIL